MLFPLPEKLCFHLQTTDPHFSSFSFEFHLSEKFFLTAPYKYSLVSYSIVTT